MRDQMTYAGHAKAILLLGLPLVGGHLAQMAIQITDTLMMGWYSIPGLAAMVICLLAAPASGTVSMAGHPKPAPTMNLRG